MAYSEQSYRDMQQDALERLRQMQLRSKTAVGEAPAESSPPVQPPEPAAVPAMSRAQPAQSNDILSGLSGLVGSLGTDKLLLLLILYLLYKNKADWKLLLAVGYLLM